MTPAADAYGEMERRYERERAWHTDLRAHVLRLTSELSDLHSPDSRDVFSVGCCESWPCRTEVVRRRFLLESS